jgi:hypothetical protein
MKFAEKTSVPIDRTKGEIEKTLSKYHATGFVFGQTNDKAIVMFEMQQKRIKFILPLAVAQKTKNTKGHVLSQIQTDQENRRLWRCLLLSIKSKLECVESGISSFEEEFLSHIVLPNGQTMGEYSIPQIKSGYQNNEMPPLLGY